MSRCKSRGAIEERGDMMEDCSCIEEGEGGVERGVMEACLLA